MDDKEIETTKEFVLDEEKKEIEDILFDGKKLNVFQRIAIKWRGFNKKIKALIIIAFLLFIAATVILVYAFVIKEPDKKGNNPIPENIVVKENYKYKDGFLIILDSKENEIGTYECRNKDEALCYVAMELDDDNFDIPDKVFENNEPVVRRSKIYHEKYVFIHDNKSADDGVIVLYDLTAQKEVESFLGIKSYDTNNSYLVLKNKDGEYGLAELKDTGLSQILNYDYEYMGIILNDTKDAVIVEKSNKWSVMDYEGKTILKNLDKEIKNCNSKYVSVYDAKDGYSLINYNKEQLLENYVYIELLSDYIIVVDSNNLLRVSDYNGVKMNEDGIKLFNKNYNKTLIYKEDGTYKETKAAYEYEINGETLIIRVHEETTVKAYAINLLEGKFSASLKYYSYLDGKLYFYKDEAKKELIGAYECEYKNNVTSTTKELDKCFLAMDVNEDNNEMVKSLNIVSITPIVNNRFVFIRDALTLAGDSSVKINLYDLNQNKILANYISVNTYGRPDNSIPYHEQIEEMIVIGKNKNSKYGAFSVNKTSIVPSVSFEYDSLEKLEEYLLGKKNGKWMLLNYQGEKISGEFTAAVRSYNGNYVKLLSNKRYYIYNINGTIVSEDNYKYAELYKNFYAGVDDVNQLTIYNYEGIPMINDNTIKLKEAQSFNIDINEDVVILSFSAENGTSVYKYDLTTWNRID